MAADNDAFHKAFRDEAKRLQEAFGMTADQAEMLAAVKFWDCPYVLEPNDNAKKDR
jgi:hypothetical protein